MLWPSDVLPTPGGPTKHRIGLLPSGLSLRTARYSRIRRLTFSRPKWSASRTALASWIFISLGTESFHGSSVIHSSQVLSIEDSPELSPMRDRRLNSFFT